MPIQYEILFASSTLSSDSWKDVILKIARFLPIGSKWQIIVSIEHGILHYYLYTSRRLPTSIGSDSVLLKKCTGKTFAEKTISGLVTNRWSDNVATILDRVSCKSQQPLFIVVNFQVYGKKIWSHATVTYKSKNKICTKKLFLSLPSQLLAVDFKKHRNYTYKKIPKYTKVEKVLGILQDESKDALLQLQTYPYTDQPKFLSLEDYSFAKHSFIIGGSGVGKSKFIANFVHQVYRSSGQYQVVIIDPHDALKDDFVDLERAIVDFTAFERSINLFEATTDNISVNIELLLGLFKTLIADNYNSRLERVLRYSIYVLLAHQNFSFTNLRRLVLDLDYRNQLLANKEIKLPVNVQQFFLTDFQELKSQAYNVSFAPIISFIDEMIMVPVFNTAPPHQTLQELLQNNFLNIFSLNRLEFGDKVVQTVSGLIMQQLFSLAEQRSLTRHLIIIIDEVSVVENPILTRFLSELRKFDVSVILAGQYFAQITPELRSAILANTTNYYIFRTSKADASVLAQNLEIKPVDSNDPDDQPKLITGLKHRECIVQVEYNGELLPTFKAKSLDLKLGEPIPETIYHHADNSPLETQTKTVIFDFSLDGVDVGAIMKQNSTSRKKI